MGSVAKFRWHTARRLVWSGRGEGGRAFRARTSAVAETIFARQVLGSPWPNFPQGFPVVEAGSSARTPGIKGYARPAAIRAAARDRKQFALAIGHNARRGSLPDEKRHLGPEPRHRPP